MPATPAGPTLTDMMNVYFGSLLYKAMLLDASFTFNKHTHAFRSSVTGEITGTGYVAGGIPLTGVEIGQDTTNSRIEIRADEANFGTLTATGIAQILVYTDTGTAASDRIVGVHTFTAESPAGENFTYSFNDDDANLGTKGVIGYISY